MLNSMRTKARTERVCYGLQLYLRMRLECNIALPKIETKVHFLKHVPNTLKLYFPKEV